jgi:hypothetical protein
MKNGWKCACGWAPVVAALGLSLAGCAGGGRATRPLAEEQVVTRKSATKEELLVSLENQMARFANLKAKASVQVSKQDILVPAGMTDNLRRLSGKEYNKTFPLADVNGILLLSRGLDGLKKVRFSGEVIGMQNQFMLLGRGNQFWVMIPSSASEPTTEPGSSGEKVAEDMVYVGTEDRRKVRPAEFFSLRPQDVAELLLFDEVYETRDGPMICYMETWPDFYVLNFLLPAWNEHIFSKIWFERGDMTVAIHQLFNGAGQVVAEARFKAYDNYKGRRSDLMVSVPLEMDVIWPGDFIVMRMSLSNVAVNVQDRDFVSSLFEPNFGEMKEVQVPAGTLP